MSENTYAASHTGAHDETTDDGARDAPAAPSRRDASASTPRWARPMA